MVVSVTDSAEVVSSQDSSTTEELGRVRCSASIGFAAAHLEVLLHGLAGLDGVVGADGAVDLAVHLGRVLL